ncbi:hypothetical protein DUNSADRAFT_17779 [Dunaliella salina]|uniref:Encoded protein n=1 Tax=Dunaliella salina TaxID=3046 RepID=A0ABQ7G136_DUNSA|nr:hypothetical protein DUNSADRAFT_17779 [Dunaliella salina]|eukprot:KAF5828323.1 hypothetical protein DUNSADRAFT_17779 [Dunaliella salina]
MGGGTSRQTSHCFCEFTVALPPTVQAPGALDEFALCKLHGCGCELKWMTKSARLKESITILLFAQSCSDELCQVSLQTQPQG